MKLSNISYDRMKLKGENKMNIDIIDEMIMPIITAACL